MKFTDEHLQQLYRYGISLSQNEAHAYDLLQDALESYLKRPPLNDAASMGYIRSIMRNRYIDQYRHRNRFPEEGLETIEDTIGIDTRLLEDIVITEQQLDVVWQQLSVSEREIMFLWAVEDMSANDIAVELDMPRGSVLSKIYRLRNRIKDSNGSFDEGVAL